MLIPDELITRRLKLRRWKADDRIAFAELNADPLVNEFLPGPFSRDESDALADRIVAHFDEYGYGLWAVEIPGVVSFAGFIGLVMTRFDAHFTPNVEVGWRLASDCWGKGYATEGARAAIGFAFDVLQLPEVVSFTVPENVRSRRVMEKIGMTHNPSDDFDHPNLPDAHRLQRHVLYRIVP